jgi:hypothetical protein
MVEFTYEHHQRKLLLFVTSIQVTKYIIPLQTNERLNLFIYDMPGFEHEKGLAEELKLILEGRLPDDYQVNETL